MVINDVSVILKQNGLKVTTSRVNVLSVIISENEPVSADMIINRLKDKSINAVTVYRTLSSFEKKGILRQIDLRKGAVFYELKNDHHHHVVCKSCGELEDFDLCIEEDLVNSILKKSKKFKVIDDHALEFFGQCKKCQK